MSVAMAREGAAMDRRRRPAEGQSRGVLGRISDEVRSWFGYGTRRGRGFSAKETGRRVADAPPVVRGESIPARFGRSDPSIRAEIAARLASEADIEITDLTAYVAFGRVVLEGAVGSEALRRRVEAIVMRVEGVREVSNHLRVHPAP